MKVGLVVIATGKYFKFIQPLIDSIDEHFFVGFDVTLNLFVDEDNLIKTTELTSERVRPNYFLVEKEIWPYPTLHRYKYFHNEREALQADYLYYCDADMKFVSPIGAEIIPQDHEELTVVKHPGFWDGGGTFETRPESKAYSPNATQYYAGGFNGGERDKFLKMCEELSKNIQIDESNEVTAIHNDESHLNCYCVDRILKELSPSYCFPENAIKFPKNWNVPFRPKLLALDKNHKEMRS